MIFLLHIAVSNLDSDFYHFPKSSALAFPPSCLQLSHPEKSISSYLTLQSFLIVEWFYFLIQYLWIYSVSSWLLYFYYSLLS